MLCMCSRSGSAHNVMHSNSYDMAGGDEGGMGTAPVWVKFLWVCPVLRVVVEEVNGKVNNCSLGDSDSIDFNGFLSRAGGPKGSGKTC